MARKSNNLPFEEAREFIRTQCIASSSQYGEWYKSNRPKTLPRYPHRAYSTEWKGWNDFLGNNNIFEGNIRRAWRPFAEAMAYVHKLGLATEPEWMKFVQTQRDKLPEDIPSRPDLVYDDWRSWKHWLGNRPQEKVEAQQQIMEESAIYYVIQERDYVKQGTVFTFGVEKGGVSGLKERWDHFKDFRVIKMFDYNDQMMDKVQTTIDRLSTPYYGAANVRIVPNIYSLLEEIGNYLDFTRAK